MVDTFTGTEKPSASSTRQEIEKEIARKRMELECLQIDLKYTDDKKDRAGFNGIE